MDTVVRARIDATTKERASDALADMGLSVSDAIRLLMLCIADERRLPFDVAVQVEHDDSKYKAEAEKWELAARRNESYFHMAKSAEEKAIQEIVDVAEKNIELKKHISRLEDVLIKQNKEIEKIKK